MRNILLLAPLVVVAGALVALAPGCGSNGELSAFDAGAGTGGDGGDVPPGFAPFGGDGSAGEAAPPCVGLECKVVQCASGKTTLKGTVYDPSGKLGLYNIIVYVPNAPLDPISHGATCDSCGATIKSPVATALTDTKGQFVLEDIPVMDDMPLVVQVGKWRRQFTIPHIDSCVDNVVPDAVAADAGADKTLRLPRKKSEGDMPKIALTLGGCDALACLFSRMGIDPTEFTNPAGTGAFSIFKGVGGGDVVGGGATDPQTTLWNDINTLKKYDIAIFTCECSENNQTKPPADMQVVHDYLSMGGRVLGSHYHYTWFKNGPLPGTADEHGIASWASGNTSSPFTVDTSFPKGKAFGDWLVNVGATATPTQIALTSVANDIGTTTPAVAQRWIYGPPVGGQAESTKYISFNAPIGQPPAKQCGRGTLSDIHVSDTQFAGTVPTTCTGTNLTAQEKAFVFLFFDLSACVQDETKPPVPPPAGPN